MKGNARYLGWAGVVVALCILFYSVRSTISHDPWTWVGVFLTVAVFSFLYRENRLYRFAEHLVVGVANGYSISFTVHRVLGPYVAKPLSAGFKALATEGPSWKLLDPNSPATTGLPTTERASWTCSRIHSFASSVKSMAG
jgi:hypothetical protein